MKLPIPSDQLKKILVEQNLIAPERYDELYQEAERKSQSVIDVLVSEKIVERNYLSDLIARDAWRAAGRLQRSQDR